MCATSEFPNEESSLNCKRKVKILFVEEIVPYLLMLPPAAASHNFAKKTTTWVYFSLFFRRGSKENYESDSGSFRRWALLKDEQTNRIEDAVSTSVRDLPAL